MNNNEFREKYGHDSKFLGIFDIYTKLFFIYPFIIYPIVISASFAAKVGTHRVSISAATLLAIQLLLITFHRHAKQDGTSDTVQPLKLKDIVIIFISWILVLYLWYLLIVRVFHL